MSDDLFCEKESTVDLRKASDQIADQFITLAIKELASGSANFIPKLTYYFNGNEATFAVDECETSIPFPTAHYFSVVEGISIEISAAESISAESCKGDLDSAYLYSPEDEDDEGIIMVWVSLPPDLIEASKFLALLSPELRGHLAHEMQHSIQRMVYGYPVGSAEAQGVESHMVDAAEIDARIEEIIVQLKEPNTENELSMFTIGLKSYIDKYLERNLEKGKENSKYLLFYDKMLAMHLCAYKKKKNCE